MNPGFKREVVAKLKMPMPINQGLTQVAAGLEKIYGPSYVGGNDPAMFEDGWFIIWRKVPDTADKDP